MFRVEFFCDDKQLSVALWRLTGIAIEAPKATPVMNAKKTRNGIEQITSGTITALFEAHLDKHKPKTINVADVRKFLQDNGTAPSSGTYVLQNLLAAKRIKKAAGAKSGVKVKYDVLPKLARAAKKTANGTGAHHGK